MAMEGCVLDLPALLKNFVNEETGGVVNTIREGIQDGDLQMMQLVEALGPFLTDTVPESRAHATKLLADVLCSLHTGSLTTQEVEVLAVFFTDRLKDHHSVVPHILKGLLELVQHKGIPDDNIKRILLDVFRELSIQSMPQADRRNVYKIVHFLLQEKLPVLRQMESDFVLGFVQALDGEKDPRNLLIAFSCVQVIASKLSLGVFAEELFEVVACYFPIDFMPPPNDPHGVSQADLILGLRQCFAASPKFAPFCLPLLAEKLSASMASAKVDSLLTLAATAGVYGPESLQEFSGTFWSCIRREVFGATSEALETSALAALTAMVQTFSGEILQGSKNSLLDEFIKEVYQDCHRYVCEPQQRLVQPSARVLMTVARASDAGCSQITALLAPLLLEQIQMHHQHGDDRRTLLELFLELLDAVRSWSGKGDSGDENLRACYKQPWLNSLEAFLADPTPGVRCLAVRGLVRLHSIPGMLDPEDCRQLIIRFLQISLSERDPSPRDESISALGVLSQSHGAAVLELVVPTIAEKLSSRGAEKLSDKELEPTTETLMRTLATISTSLAVLERASPALLTYLQSLIDKPDALEEAKVTCQCLKQASVQTVTSPECRRYALCNLLPHCVQVALQAALCDRDTVLNDATVVMEIAAVLRVVVQASQASEAADVLAAVQDLFIDGSLTGAFQPFASSIISQDTFRPLKLTAPAKVSQLISILSGVVCSAPRESSIPRVTELLEGLLDVSCGSPLAESRDAAAKCVAGIVNKMASGNQLEEVLNALCERLLMVLDPDVSPQGHATEGVARTAALTQWTWLTKALWLRNHPRQTAMTDRLFEWMADSSVGDIAASGFGIILRDYPDILTPKMHADVKMLFKQRFFMVTKTKLTQSYEAAPADAKPHYLKAFSQLLKFIPRQVLVTELPELLPLVMQCLLCEEGEDLWMGTLDTLHDLFTNTPDLLLPYLDELVAHLLKFAQYKPLMRIRIAALRCLAEVTSLPGHHVFRHQTVVTKTLGVVLDDHKRLVRREAARTRELWYLLPEPKK